VDRRGLIATAVVTAALLLPGCGATPPQAPGPVAYQLNKALSTFSTACGHAAEVSAFSRSGSELAGLDRLAAGKVPVVARIYHRDKAWVFQGKTVAQLVQMSVSFLTECGLHGAAARLTRATAG
jgi:hypothetical protein